MIEYRIDNTALKGSSHDSSLFTNCHQVIEKIVKIVRPRADSRCPANRGDLEGIHKGEIIAIEGR